MYVCEEGRSWYRKRVFLRRELGVITAVWFLGLHSEPSLVVWA